MFFLATELLALYFLPLTSKLKHMYITQCLFLQMDVELAFEMLLPFL